ncbi:MAG: methyl-accepting chemotaxis protein, partial [Spongiibacteraceae bacterium]
MTWFNNLSIKFKILFIPAIAIVGFVLFFLFIINSGAQNSARLAEIEDTYFPVLELANSNIVILERMGEVMGNAASAGEEEVLEQARSMGSQITKNLNTQIQLRPSQAAQLKQIALELNNYMSLAIRLTQQMIDGTVDFSKLAGTAEKKRQTEEIVAKSLHVFRDESHQSFIQTVADAKETENINLQVGGVIGAITITILLAVAFSVTTVIYRSVQAISESLRNIAQGEGDLTQRLPQTSNDELGELVHWFNVFIDKLHGTIGEVIHVIGPLTDVSQQLNTVANETASTSADQSHSSELVSNAMIDM